MCSLAHSIFENALEKAPAGSVEDAMVKPPNDKIEGNPARGDAILRRMLRTKPKLHKDLVDERKATRASKRKTKQKRPEE
jgi:hypothetical protein